jgi:N-carbamoyl-L-amino-acid hydrolase
MLGSLVYAGGHPLADALGATSIDGKVLGAELERIGYAGTAPVPLYRPHAFVELHIEQGPVLDADGITIGAVEDLQGISWQEIAVTGQSNHAGTTPMRLRHDAGYCAAIAAFCAFAYEMGGARSALGRWRPQSHQRCRGSRDTHCRSAQHRRSAAQSRSTPRRVPGEARPRRGRRSGPSACPLQLVTFDPAVIGCIEGIATRLGFTHRRMTSGAGHDAQMMARLCPTAMIFVPSVKGISHNAAEHTAPSDLAAGTNVLLHTLLEQAEEEDR